MFFTLITFVLAASAPTQNIAVGKIAYPDKKTCMKEIPKMVSFIDMMALDIYNAKPIYKEKLCLTAEQVQERLKDAKPAGQETKEKEENTI